MRIAARFYAGDRCNRVRRRKLASRHRAQRAA